MTAATATSDRLFLESVTPNVRKLLVRERARAMRGVLDDALRSLRDVYQATDQNRVPDRVALGTLRAELLDLDLQGEAALAVFDEDVMPLAGELPREHRFAVEQNRADLRVQQWSASGHGDFYNLVDLRRATNYDWLDYRSLFEARREADEGKHYAALPALWQQLRRAYLHGCWRAQRITAQLLAAECVALGEWVEAVHHFVASGHDNLAAKIADGLIVTRRSEAVRAAVDRLIRQANLKLHFAAACKLVGGLADALPDADLPRVSDWLLPRAAAARGEAFGPDPVVAAWAAVKSVGARLPAEYARRWVAAATAQPIWTTRLGDPSRFVPGRDAVVEAVLHLAYALPEVEAGALAEKTLPLLADSTHSPEYDKIVNLLCHLAERGGEGVKALLGEALYSPERPLNAVLVSVAGHFGKGDRVAPDHFGSWAGEVIVAIRRQVQWTQPGEEPVPPADTMSRLSREVGGRVFNVFLVQNSLLIGVASHRAKLTEPGLTDLIRAVLDLAGDADNLCTNREGMLYGLREFADCVPPALRLEVVDALEPLARGPVRESEYRPTAAEANNPLNPFQIHMGSPEAVQAAALVALAAFDRGEVKGVRVRVQSVLAERLYDHRPQIRQADYAAARLCTKVDDEVLMGVLSGLRDADPAAAVSAFAALTSQRNWKLTLNHWRLFLLAARVAQQSPNGKLRGHAALTLNRLAAK